MSEQIKPCPFCGEAEEIDESGMPMGSKWVHCYKCGAEGPSKSDCSHIAKWNAAHNSPEWRSEPPDKPGLWISARNNSYTDAQFATEVDILEKPARLIRLGALWCGPFDVQKPF